MSFATQDVEINGALQQIAGPTSYYGPSTQQNFSSGGRAINTVYQNLTGKSLLVEISLTATANATMRVSVGSTVGGLTQEEVARIVANEYQSVTFYVPSTWYYEITDAQGNQSIVNWVEVF